jgi:hypothetical protein
VGDSELSEVEFTCFNEELYAHTVANACKMTHLKSLSYRLPYEFGGDQFDAPYDQLAKSLATLKLTHLQLYPVRVRVSRRRGCGLLSSIILMAWNLYYKISTKAHNKLYGNLYLSLHFR